MYSIVPSTAACSFKIGSEYLTIRRARLYRLLIRY